MQFTDINTMVLIIVFVFPGFIALSVYRLYLPARYIEWNSVVLQCLMFNSFNTIIMWYFVRKIVMKNIQSELEYWIVFYLVTFLFPVFLTLIYIEILKSKKFMKKLQLPFATAWDYFFEKRKPVFVLIHLSNGDLVGGYYGNDSYASSFPNEGDIYLTALYEIDKHGKFTGEIIPDTKGLLIRKDQYSYIELFDVPETQVSQEEVKENE